MIMMHPRMNEVPKSPFLPPGLFEAPLFTDIIKGTFIRRPNRFVVHCSVEGGVLDAYLPNPGRLWELFLPGRIVYLVRRPPGGSGTLTHMAVAVEREGIPLLLHTHLNNAVAAALIGAKKIPGLEDATVSPSGGAGGTQPFRFSSGAGRQALLPGGQVLHARRQIVSPCFPMPSRRGGKGTWKNLPPLSRRGTACGVLFLVHWPHARFFLPDYHTDLEFARTFAAVRKDLLIKAVSLAWRPDLSLAPEIRDVAIPWDTIEREAKDSGSYIILLHIPRGRDGNGGKPGRS